MGQRSQIYVRFNTRNGKKFLVPRYYQWNYGTRMISRARGIIEWLEKNSTSLEYDLENQEKLCKIMDINFDYKDVVLGQDLIEEFKEKEKNNFAGFVFLGQANNDGQLFIDVNIDYEKGGIFGDKENTEIKYCFLSNPNNFTPMDGDQYIQWDDDYGEENVPSWMCNPYVRNEIGFTIENIDYIKEHAKLMAEKEVKEYIYYDYVTDMGIEVEPLPF